MRSLGFVLLLTTEAAAQPARDLDAPAAPPAVVETPATRSFCLEGTLQCEAIPLLEFGIRAGASSTMTFDYGLLINHHRHAFGATVGWLAHEHRRQAGSTTDFSFAAKARYRRWLRDDLGLDVGLGGGRFGAIGEVAFEWRDIIALSAGVNTFPVDLDHQASTTVGVRFGAKGVGLLFYALMSSIGG